MKKHDVGFLAGFGFGVGLAGLKYIVSKSSHSPQLQARLAQEWESAIEQLKPKISKQYHVSSFSTVLSTFKNSVQALIEEAESEYLDKSSSKNKPTKKSPSSKKMFKGIKPID